MRDRLWQATTPKPGREIRDKLIRSWEKTIAVTNLLNLDSSGAESEELQNESNLLRKQAVELFSDLIETNELWEYVSTCS